MNIFVLAVVEVARCAGVFYLTLHCLWTLRGKP
jgi:hypothetical protein